jgi:hypothetical protein
MSELPPKTVTIKDALAHVDSDLHDLIGRLEALERDISQWNTDNLPWTIRSISSIFRKIHLYYKDSRLKWEADQDIGDMKKIAGSLSSVFESIEHNKIHTASKPADTKSSLLDKPQFNMPSDQQVEKWNNQLEQLVLDLNSFRQTVHEVETSIRKWADGMGHAGVSDLLDPVQVKKFNTESSRIIEAMRLLYQLKISLDKVILAIMELHIHVLKIKTTPTETKGYAPYSGKYPNIENPTHLLKQPAPVTLKTNTRFLDRDPPSSTTRRMTPQQKQISSEAQAMLRRVQQSRIPASEDLHDAMDNLHLDDEY